MFWGVLIQSSYLIAYKVLLVLVLVLDRKKSLEKAYFVNIVVVVAAQNEATRVLDGLNVYRVFVDVFEVGEGLCNGLRVVVVLGSGEIVGEFPRLALRSRRVAAIVIIIMWLVIWCLCFGKILGGIR